MRCKNMNVQLTYLALIVFVQAIGGKLVEIPSDVTVRVGEVARFNCSTNLEDPVDWRWTPESGSHENILFSGGIITVDYKQDIDIAVQHDSIRNITKYDVIITSTTPRYAGKFECIDNSGLGPDKSSGFLTVQDGRFTPDEVVALANETARFTCQTQSLTPVEWHLMPVNSAKKIPLYTGGTVTFSYRDCLKVTNVTNSDASGKWTVYTLEIRNLNWTLAGRYECRDDSDTEGELFYFFQLIVLERNPKCSVHYEIANAIEKLTCFLPKEPLYMACQIGIYGNHKSEMTWRLDDDATFTDRFVTVYTTPFSMTSRLEIPDKTLYSTFICTTTIKSSKGRRIFSYSWKSVLDSNNSSKNVILPQNTVVFTRNNVELRCGRAAMSRPLDWRYRGPGSSTSVYIYVNGSMLSQNSRYSVDSSTKGHYNLIIMFVEMQDAGKYICVDNSGSGPQSSCAELVVIYRNPDCKLISSSNIVGNNTCGMSLGRLDMVCMVQFRGNLAPQAEWRNNKGEILTYVHGVTNDTIPNSHATYSFAAEATAGMHNSTYTCRMFVPNTIYTIPGWSVVSGRYSHTWTSPRINVSYGLNSMQTIMNCKLSSVICMADTNPGPVLYTWHDKDSRTISTHQELILLNNQTVPNNYTCIATYIIDNHPCNVTGTVIICKIDVGETTSRDVIVVTSVVVTIVVMGLTLLLLYKKRTCTINWIRSKITTIRSNFEIQKVVYRSSDKPINEVNRTSEEREAESLFKAELS